MGMFFKPMKEVELTDRTPSLMTGSHAPRDDRSLVAKDGQNVVCPLTKSFHLYTQLIRILTIGTMIGAKLDFFECDFTFKINMSLLMVLLGLVDNAVFHFLD